MPTDQFTGSRKERNKKMEASKEKSGSQAQSTSETGKKTRRKASESRSTRMEINTKGSGFPINGMDKELTGRTKEAS